VTEAPSVARARAVASPIPAVEPVTSARFPFSPRSITGIDPGQPQTAPQSSCVGLDLEVFGDPTRPHMSTRTAGPHGPAVFGDRCSWADGNGCESGYAKCRPRREAPVSVNCRARPLRSDASCRGMAFAVALHVTTDQEAGVRVLGRASSRPSTADSTGRQLRFQLRWGRWRPTLASANPLKARWPPPAANGQLALRSRRSWVRIPPGASAQREAPSSVTR